MRLQHVTVAIAEDGAESARRFYGGVLGLEERPPVPPLDPERFIWFRVGDSDLELHLQLTDEAPPDRPHFCLAVDDLEPVRARLHEAGVEVASGTQLVGRPRFTCRDPFGNQIEFARIGG